MHPGFQRTKLWHSEREGVITVIGGETVLNNDTGVNTENMDYQDERLSSQLSQIGQR